MENHLNGVNLNLKGIYKLFEEEIMRKLNIEPQISESYINFKIGNITLVNFQFREKHLNIHLHSAKGNFNDPKGLFKDVSAKNYSKQTNKVIFKSNEIINEEHFHYVLDRIFDVYNREVK